MPFDTGPLPRPHDAPEPLLDINTTPLIDVLLVLLVMLIVTVPVQWHAVRLALPAAATAPPARHAEPIRIAIDAAGAVYWAGERMAAEQLAVRLAETARADPAAEVEVRTDRAAPFGAFAALLARMRDAGLARVRVTGHEQIVR